jgi:predicted adenylyl cyclase CyaB
MIEVEAKVRLTKGDFDRLAKEIPTFAKPQGVSLKRDRYYGGGQVDLRIREEGGEVVLGLKTRVLKKGIESNEEIEFPIEKPEKWDRLLRKNGFPLRMKKEKRCISFRFKQYTIELNTVKSLGKFLEIEHLVRNASQVSKAKKGLVELFGRLGFKPNDFERKFYIELLEEKRKKNYKL